MHNATDSSFLGLMSFDSGGVGNAQYSAFGADDNINTTENFQNNQYNQPNQPQATNYMRSMPTQQPQSMSGQRTYFQEHYSNKSEQSEQYINQNLNQAPSITPHVSIR